MCARSCARRWLHKAGRSDVRSSVRSIFQQAPRNDLCLNLRRALEDTKDARVAKNTADRILECETIPAMDLKGIVRRGPSNARGQQLRHTGLEIATPAFVLFARGIVSDLARDGDLHRHHGKLVAHARIFKDSLAALLTIQ